jgi:hypothetical protein
MKRRIIMLVAALCAVAALTGAQPASAASTPQTSITIQGITHYCSGGWHIRIEAWTSLDGGTVRVAFSPSIWTPNATLDSDTGYFTRNVNLAGSSSYYSNVTLINIKSGYANAYKDNTRLVYNPC